MADGGALERFEGAVATLLRLPAAGPEPPPGSGEVRLFRAAPRYLQYNLARWGLSQSFAVFGLAVGFGFVAALPPALWFVEILEAFGIAIFLGQLPVSFGAVWLDYKRRWYLVTDRSLRIREGVWTVHERTMSFANVQNLEIKQGPISRLLGLSSLEVRSAGGGQGGSGPKGQKGGDDLHVARFRGVDNAEAIRDLILARLRTMRGAGLGDPDEEQESDPLDAARAVLAEARALRTLLIPQSTTRMRLASALRSPWQVDSRVEDPSTGGAPKETK